MPTPPSRGEVEALWQAVARGDVTRESVSAWVEPFMFATYEDKPDLLVMQALQHLHGFDMTHRSPDGNLTRKARTRHPLHAGRYRHRPPMPGNQTNVLPNVHITERSCCAPSSNAVRCDSAQHVETPERREQRVWT